jgi:hypothetical protein
MKKNKSPDLIQDLYVTGGHAILHDKLTHTQQKKMDSIIDYCKKNGINYSNMIDDKYKVIACYDPKFVEIKKEHTYNIYHLVLENKHKERNYGIYANGILVESTEELNVERKKHNTKCINENEKAQQKMGMKKLGSGKSKITRK